MKNKQRPSAVHSSCSQPRVRHELVWVINALLGVTPSTYTRRAVDMQCVDVYKGNLNNHCDDLNNVQRSLRQTQGATESCFRGTDFGGLCTMAFVTLGWEK